MRDPARIDSMLDDLRTLWHRSPDLRLTQLIVNLVRPKGAVPEVFYFEDDRLHEEIRQAIEEWPFG